MFMLFSFLLGKMLFNYVGSFFIILVRRTEISQSIVQRINENSLIVSPAVALSSAAKRAQIC